MFKEIFYKISYHLNTLGPRFKKRSFLAKEIVKNKFSPKRKWNILFSSRDDWEKNIRKGFEHTRHVIRFDTLSADNIKNNDLIVPLSIRDLKILNDNKNLIRANPLPIPSNEVINLCDDKLIGLDRISEKCF